MKIKFLVLLSVVLLFFSACSSSEETAKDSDSQEEPEIYVFDDVNDFPEDTIATENEEIKTEKLPVDTRAQFFVQVGAFTTKSRADQFVAENRSKTTYPLNIKYSDDVQLYVVQLPSFPTKTDAEKVRDEFWRTGNFKDAFIVVN